MRKDRKGSPPSSPPVGWHEGGEPMGGWWECRVGGGLATSVLQEAEGYAMSAVRLLLVSLESFRRPHYGTWVNREEI